MLPMTMVIGIVSDMLKHADGGMIIVQPMSRSLVASSMFVNRHGVY
jgi:hypothetical protein